MVLAQQVLMILGLNPLRQLCSGQNCGHFRNFSAFQGIRKSLKESKAILFFQKAFQPFWPSSISEESGKVFPKGLLRNQHPVSSIKRQNPYFQTDCSSYASRSHHYHHHQHHPQPSAITIYHHIKKRF